MSKKATEKLEVDNIEVLADKGYFDVDDLKNCEENNITAYVAKNSSGNSAGDSRYFSDKFIYNFGSNTYTCPEGKILYCLTKKFGAKDKRYANYEVCDNCKNKQYCTTSKKGRTVIRTKDKDFIELINRRTKKNSEKYKQRQSIVEHPFGTIKRTINILGARQLMECLA